MKMKRRVVKATPIKTPRTRKPEHMSVEEWQVALRREYGRGQVFEIKNLGAEPFFSEFAVTNPKSGRTYRVAIRGQGLGVNFCSCPDFAVNTLGTCKHVEWLLHKLARRRGGKSALRVGFLPPYSEVFLQYGAQRRVWFRAGTTCSEALHAAAGRYFDELGLLRVDAFRTLEQFVREASGSGCEFRIYEDALAFVARLRDDERRRQEIVRRFERNGASKALDGLLKVKLYPYQREGALFAAKAGRCLLADDMGLGKTIQSIAAVEILAQVAGVERALVVCPTALKYQWQQEVERFAERSAMVIEGFQSARDILYGKESFYKITNYETVHRDLGLINGWHPDIVILDEAQRIKNWETRRAKSVKQIDTTHAIVLTGTPLENRLSELHSIMEFVDRYHLGPLFRFLYEHQHTDEHGQVVGYRNLDRIKESLAPVLLRRRKKEVLQQLPERTDKHLFVEMTEAQWRIHEEYREEVARLVAKWRRRGFLTEEDQRKLMIALQFMRMSCNSTYLIDKQTDQGPKPDECCILLDDILAIPENKAVIFSQWLGTHELLIRRLEAEERPYSYYHGSLDGKARKKSLEQFKQNPECRLLLCTESGGVGLNLQHASVVINMDQPWNPAVLEQRIGRVHRLGQQRHVQVFHFVSRGTIEHGMLSVLKFKTSMFEGVLDGGESEVFLGGSKMKKFMETVEKVAEHTPQHVPTTEETKELEESGALEMPGGGEELAPAEAAEPRQEAWSNVLSAGMELLGKLGQALQSPQPEKAGGASFANLVERSERTGKPELRVPLPDAETAERLGSLLVGLGDLLKGIAGKR
ncbi:MAG: DEAD/DEAH box helicase [Candidatus Hydrogenedentes bacterium]|nr:DEAD/DEAH box helicase [Candidatus Hydrogenedentota bacterium]